MPETNSTDAGDRAVEAVKDYDKRTDRIYLVPYPKVVFFYPTFFTALIAGIWLAFANPENLEQSGAASFWGVAFMWVFAVNVVVISFDFPRSTSLTLFFVVAALILGLVLLFNFNPGLAPAIARFFDAIQPLANSAFYFLIAAVFGFIYIWVLIKVQFDYWEVRPNELLHHHGILSDLKRFSAPHLRIDKEINDVFEYLLLGSGRLILQPSGERRAVVLDNVPFIARKEEAITKMLGALQVQVRGNE